MRLSLHSFPTVQDNVYYDDVLLSMAQKHGAGECLRFWQSPQYGIVLGRMGRIEEDVDQAAAAKDGVPIMHRTSGGGTVVQGPGCWNYSLVLAKARHKDLDDLRASYAWISKKVIAALRHQGIDAQFCPISDLALSSNQKKFSGNAQRRGKDYLLHHGTILVDFDVTLISKYLRMPKDMPEYRQGRRHCDFITNIYIKFDMFQSDFINAFGIKDQPQMPTPQELGLLQKYHL